MSFGAVLAGVGVLIVLVAYVARPFRKTAEDRTLDRAIEAWIAQMEDKQGVLQHSVGTDGGAGARDDQRGGGPTDDGVINNCSQCGRRVSQDDRYCSGCGNRLRRGGV